MSVKTVVQAECRAGPAAMPPLTINHVISEEKGFLELLGCSCLCSFSQPIKLIDSEEECRQLQPELRSLKQHVPLFPVDHAIGGEHCLAFTNITVTPALTAGIFLLLL